MTAVSQERLKSLDFFRGLIMFLLVGESTELYWRLKDAAPDGSFWGKIVVQFHHHAWNGLHFWDLVQPYFMFIVGVAMVFSLEKRWAKGDTWGQTFKHIGLRCLTLLAFGVGLHCVYSHKMVWELWNVLSQLSVTILVAFLIFKWPAKFQLIFSIGLLVLTEVFYRACSVDGFDQAFVQGKNFGAFMDTVLMGKINGGGWVAINAIPTSAHTIWGVLAGKVLMSAKPDMQKVKTLLIWGVVGLVIGYALDWTHITPIIKRICTSSFVIVSGGWAMVTLAFSYWLIDVKGVSKWTTFFAIVGMNPIFIYLFTQTVGHQWVNEFFAIFTVGTLSWISVPEPIALIVNSVVVFAFEWYLCYWLYKKRIFFKI